MPRTCCVCGDVYKKATLHRFPKKVEVCQLWINAVQAIRGDNFVPGKNTHLCGNHFTADCFNTPLGIVENERTFLKTGSVPTLFFEDDNDSDEINVTALKAEVNTEVQECILGTGRCDSEDIEDVHEHEIHAETKKTIDNILEASTSSQAQEFEGRCDNVDEASSSSQAQEFEGRFDNIAEASTSSQAQEFEGRCEISAKRVPSTPHRIPPAKRARLMNPRYLGDVDENIFQSPRVRRRWQLATEYVEKSRRTIKALRQRCGRLEKRVTNLKTLVSHLRKKNLVSENASQILETSMSETAKELLKRYLQKKSRGKFSPALRSFATTLQFFSARAYDYVRKNFMNVLPHPKTVTKWYQKVDGNPGITKQAIDTVRNKVIEARKEGKELYFGLTIDEMSIKRQVEWDGKEYNGYVDLGTGVDDDNMPEANYALVFMLVNINGYWKIPIAYYLVNGLTGEERANLLTQCLTVLHEAEARVVSITTDGAPSNITMMNNMGASLNHEKLVPFFSHPVSGEKVHILLDACHMIKLVRNAFASRGLLKDSESNDIQWHYLERLVQLQEGEGLHAATKIRRRHMNWKQEKMKVSIAAQVFSTSVADALTFCEKDLQLQNFQGSAATAKFCRTINDIFDLLNSRNLLCKNPTKQCITRANIGTIRNKIQQYIEYLSALQDTTGNILKSNRKMGFFGLIVCMTSVLGVCDILFENPNIQFIMTYKLSQDHIETFFSAVRSRGGFNNNPTAKQFKSAYKRLLVQADVDPSLYANSVAIDETCVLHISTETSKESQIADNFENTVQHSDFLQDHDYLLYNDWYCSEYVQDIVAYLAGFIVRQIEKVITCTTCLVHLTSDTQMSKLQKRKCRGGLITASEDVVTTCILAEKTLRSYGHLGRGTRAFQSLITKTILKIPSTVFDDVDHMLEQGPLADHRTQLITMILKRYFVIRFKYIGASRTETIVRVRNLYTKLVLFKNQ